MTVLGEGEYQLLLVDRPHLPAAWAHAEPLLHKTLEIVEDRASLETVYDLLEQGRAQLWMANNADRFVCAMIGEPMHFPLRNVYAMSWIGGELNNDILLLLSHIEDWVRQYGFSSVDVMCGTRNGWERVLSKFGYQKRLYVVTKDLGPIGTGRA